MVPAALCMPQAAQGKPAPEAKLAAQALGGYAAPKPVRRLVEDSEPDFSRGTHWSRGHFPFHFRIGQFQLI